MPNTHYATTRDGLSVAYQVLGQPGPDIVYLTTFMGGIEVLWEEPSYADALRRLANVGRVMTLDVRGTGASDPVPLGALPTPEAWTDDIGAVLDAVGSDAVSIVASGATGWAGMLFAATYPERTKALVLVNSFPRALHAEDYESGFSHEVLETFVPTLVRQWGTGDNTVFFAPSRASDERFRRWWARYERLSHSPATARAISWWNLTLDVRPVLATIHVPTLLLHRKDCRTPPFGMGQYLAEHIVAAQLKVLPGTDTLPFSEDPDDVVDHIEEFVTGVPPIRQPNRTLATVLFTDIVGSTEHVTRLGDKEWMRRLDRHDDLVAEALRRYGGRKVNPTGDGMLATFDGPARGVRCAQAIIDAVQPLGVEVRAGLHTGEVELRGHDIGGIAVHIGQRVSAMAGPGEVLVSRTVTDLVAGSGLEFEDRGECDLKGVPGTLRLFALSA